LVERHLTPPPPRAAADDAELPGTRAPRFVQALLRMPLFYKIVVANAAIVALGTSVGVIVMHQLMHRNPGQSPLTLIVILVTAGVVASIAVNAVIVHLALSPLRLLEDTASRVGGGDFDARALVSPLADERMARLTHTFNGMLDALAGYRSRLRDVAVRALDAGEEDRKRISRELHDETAQMLAALLIRVRVARATRDPEVLERQLDDMKTEIGHALEGVRRFARGLRPPALDELGLAAALDAHARGLHEATGLSIRFHADELDDLLSPHAELALYRIVQEALSNVVRHAEATSARVELHRADGAIRAVVEDDGRGFEPGQVMQSDEGGMGLFGMQERAAYVGGTVEVTSTPGRGTRVEVEVPVQYDAAPEHVSAG
jgi:two-component system sensor histidine kinase UhpB